VICPSAVPRFEGISLSEQTISRRVKEVGADLKDQLQQKCKIFEHYSIALDESTDISSTAQLSIFVRGVESDFTVTEELLDVVPMTGTTTGEDIFKAVDETMDYFVPRMVECRIEAISSFEKTSFENSRFSGSILVRSVYR